MLNVKALLGPLLYLPLMTWVFGCGKSDSKGPNGGTIVDFSKNSSMQFYAASGGFVSATFYDLALVTGTIKRYTSSTASPDPHVQKELTMSSALKSSLTQKLKAVTVKSFGACTAAVCTAGRANNWIGLPTPAPARYYFAYEGDCSCASDGENQPSISYTQLNTIYEEVSSSL